MPQHDANLPVACVEGWSTGNQLRDVATGESLEFRWQLTVLPSIAHSHTAMAVAVAPIVLDNAVAGHPTE